MSERRAGRAAGRKGRAPESRNAGGSRQRAELAASDPSSQGLWEAPPPVEAPRRGSITQQLIGVSPAMQRVFRLVAKIAPTETPVLLTGESGTGKEVIAEAIHPSVQVKLLRALQNGEIRRVGASESTRVDVRVIAATNRDLRRALADGSFREDLYYRLNVFHIELPPLRERREDIPVLANYFRERLARERGKHVDRFTERAQFYLMRYDYPGNVRELENAIERAVALSEHSEITHLDLPPSFRETTVPLLDEGTAFPYSESLSLAQLEAEHIRRVLRHYAGNTTKTAHSLGISRSTLWRKMREYGL